MLITISVGYINPVSSQPRQFRDNVKMFLLELCASVLALCALLPIGEADPLPAPVHFYPYCCCGDIKAPVNDDGSTGQISLTANFKFFNNFYSSLYVSTNRVYIHTRTRTSAENVCE